MLARLFFVDYDCDSIRLVNMWLVFTLKVALEAN